MIFRSIVAFNYIAGSWLTWQTFATYPNHSLEFVLRWIGIFVIAIVAPSFWSFHYLRKFRDVFEANAGLRELAMMPVVVGGVTLLVALNLINGAR